MDAPPQYRMGIWFHLAQASRLLFWQLLIGFLLLQFVGDGDSPQRKRDLLLDRFQSERKSRVIALIHRQDRRSFLGVPVLGIDEAGFQAIAATAKRDCPLSKALAGVAEITLHATLR